MTSRKAIFIDRDGTLIAEKNYLHKPEEVEFFPGVIQALSRAAEAGFVLVMVTNQSGVGRGYALVGHHEILIPLLAAFILAE